MNKTQQRDGGVADAACMEAMQANVRREGGSSRAVRGEENEMDLKESGIKVQG